MAFKDVPDYPEISAQLQAGKITPSEAIALGHQRKITDDLQANLQKAKDYARIGGGALLTGVGTLPIFSGPVGGAVGGGMVGLGEGLIQGHSGKDLAKDAAIGAGVGAATGGIAKGMAGKTVQKAVPKTTTSVQPKANIPQIKSNPSVAEKIKPNAGKALEDNLSKRYETEIMTHYSPNEITTPYNTGRVGENMGMTTGKGMFVTNDAEYGIGSYALTEGPQGFANEYLVPKGKYGIQADLPLNQQPQHVQDFIKNFYKDQGYTDALINSEMQFKDGYQFTQKLVDTYGPDVTSVLPDYGIPHLNNPSQLERQIFDTSYMQRPIRSYPVTEANIPRLEL